VDRVGLFAQRADASPHKTGAAYRRSVVLLRIAEVERPRLDFRIACARVTKCGRPLRSAGRLHQVVDRGHDLAVDSVITSAL
jgi:hypothetical protein